MQDLKKDETGDGNVSCFFSPAQMIGAFALKYNIEKIKKEVFDETVCCLYHQKKEFISVHCEPKDAEYLKQNLSDKKD